MSFTSVTSRKGSPTRTNVTVQSSGSGLVVAANGNRKSLLFQNQGSVTIFLGGPDVAISGASRGYALFAGASFTDDATATEWWAIAASSTAILHVEEVL